MNRPSNFHIIKYILLLLCVTLFESYIRISSLSPGSEERNTLVCSTNALKDLL